MSLQSFTWNNGSENAPIVLSFEQIAALSAAGENPDITTDIGGYITTNSRKIQKFLKLSIETQFPKLRVIVDEELADEFEASVNNPNINEGSSTPIIITGASGITHEYLLWDLNYRTITIDGDISETIIKSRIHIENGQIIVDDPQENASWQAIIEVTGYPNYYKDTPIQDIPISSRPTFVISVNAKAISSITASTKEEIPINSDVEIKVTPNPIDSTKLKGAIYTFTTSTPDIVFCAGNYIRTQGLAGNASVTVNLSACNGKLKLNTTITFNVYDLRPMSFIIDQRYINGLSDPTGMVSANYILQPDGTLQIISNTGADGNPNNNTLTWIRQNSHAYVSRNTGFTGLRLKKLSDSTRKKFDDGTSSLDYISNENGEYDVFLKFGSDIYYKTEPWTPIGESTPNPNYILVTIAKELSSDDDPNEWQKWSQYKLVGVYKACSINNKLHSLSGKRPINNKNRTSLRNMASARGNNFDICDYQMCQIFCFLFYGWYSSLGSKQICGYGTTTVVNRIHYPKITGATDDLAGTDTNNTTGNGDPNPSDDKIIAGTGEGIKSINFWHLENFWGDIEEYISDMIIMEASRNETNVTKDSNKYISDYLEDNNSILICNNNGLTKTYTSKDEFLNDYSNSSSRFIAILNPKTGKIIRAINTTFNNNKSMYVNQIIGGSYADIIANGNLTNTATSDTGFCNYMGIYDAGRIFSRSGNSNGSANGIGYLDSWSVGGEVSYVGTRLIYYGDENTIHIIDDATETL